MDPLDDYYSSYTEEKTEQGSKSMLIKVRFTKWTPGSSLPQWGYMKLFQRRNESNEREANFLRQAGDCHRNVVRFLHHMDLSNNRYAIFMELCDQGSLADILYRNLHDPTYWTKDEVLNRFIIIVDTLTTLHRVGIAHRDVKPHNIFVNQNNEIRIGDFGESKEVRVNIKNTALGTPGYMSPFLEKMLENKRYKSKHIDPYKEDVWSTGKTLYEIATMNLELEIEKTDEKIRERVLKDMRNFGYRDDAIEIILSMLLVDKNSRPSMARVCTNIKNLSLDKFAIPGFDLSSIKPIISPTNTPTWTNFGMGWRTTGTGGPSIRQSYEQPSTKDRSFETIEREGCELCHYNEIFVHSCGKTIEIAQFIPFINEMIAINEKYNDITCLECQGLLPIEIFQCGRGHFDKLPNYFFT